MRRTSVLPNQGFGMATFVCCTHPVHNSPALQMVEVVEAVLANAGTVDPQL